MKTLASQTWHCNGETCIQVDGIPFVQLDFANLTPALAAQHGFSFVEANPAIGITWNTVTLPPGAARLWTTVAYAIARPRRTRRPGIRRATRRTPRRAAKRTARRSSSNRDGPAGDPPHPWPGDRARVVVGIGGAA